MKKPVAVIIGVGPGNGAAFSRRFAGSGYTVALLARSKDFIIKLASELQDAYAFICDITDADSVNQAFANIRQQLGEIDVLIYNAGSGTWGNIKEVTPDKFEASWRVNAQGLFLATQQVIPAMEQKKKGSIIIIGATASRRSGINSPIFSSAKAAQRGLAESMAKYLWPLGIHVALVMIDGIVDLATTRLRMSDKPDSFFVKSSEVAETVYWLAHQPPSVWTFEIEVRPFAENW